MKAGKKHICVRNMSHEFIVKAIEEKYLCDKLFTQDYLLV